MTLIGRRVDAVTVGVQVAVDRERLSAFWLAVQGGVGALDVPLLGWQAGPAAGLVSVLLRQVSGGQRVEIQNGDLHGVLDPRAPGGCLLDISFRASFLATHDLSVCWAYARAVGEVLGVVEGLVLRRLDLAADFAGWTFRPSDREAWVRHGRAGFASFVELDAANDTGRELVREHGGGGRRITGYTVCPGGAVMLRVYDKLQQLAAKGPDARLAEAAFWCEQSGWDGRGSVARVEFQLRTGALRSFGVKDPEQLEPGDLDQIWQALVQNWVRLVQVDTASRRCRADLDPRWEAVQSVVFEHRAEPAVRSHWRRGASAKHALGGLLSFSAFAAGRGEGLRVVLPPLDPGASDDEVRAALAGLVQQWVGGSVRLLVLDLVGELGAAGALRYLLERGSAALARASTVGAAQGPPSPLRVRRAA